MSYQQEGYGYSYSPVASYAGFWLRFLAALLDGLIVGVPVFLVSAALASTNGPGSGGIFLNPAAGPLVNILSIVAGMLYYGLLEGGPTGQTIGKRACGILVVDADSGQPGIGTGRGIGRYFARWLSQLVLYLGYLWMLWDPKKQTWHDKLARTVVVKKP